MLFSQNTFFKIFFLINVLNDKFLQDFITVLSETCMKGAQGRKTVNLVGHS